MKTISSTALAALLATTIGLTAIAPAMAQSAPPAAGGDTSHQQQFDRGRDHGGPGMGRGGFGGGMFDFGRGAEAVEIALVRLSHRVELTAEQQPLFDSFREAALAAAADLDTAMEALRTADPASTDAATPDIAARFADRITADRARLEAMEAVQPSLTAFFDSLTDAQLETLMPQRPEGAGPGHGRHFGPGANRPPMAPDADAPDAPQG